MTTTALPNALPNGYQPGDGEGLTKVVVAAARSRDYQKADVVFEWSFPIGRSYSDVVPVVDYLGDVAAEEAEAQLSKLLGEQKAKVAAATGTTAPQGTDSDVPFDTPATPTGPIISGGKSFLTSQAPEPDDNSASQGGLPWKYGQKKKGSGSIKYLPSSHLDSPTFIAAVKQLVSDQGIDPEQVIVFDDRIGNYGLEDGHAGFNVGKAVARKGSDLKDALGDRDTVSFVNFNDDGTIDAPLSNDVKALMSG